MMGDERQQQDESGGQGDVHSTAMPVAEGMAAWASANQQLGYAPANSQDLVAGLSNVAAAINHELGNDIAPSPFGPSHPDMQRDDHEGPKRQDVQMNPNRSPQSAVRAGGVREVVLEANYMDAYIVQGEINGRSVTFLVDTGATQVSIPRRIADYIGLEPTGRVGHARTANGLVKVLDTRIDSLKIGDIELNGVHGSINTGDRSEQILLGMSVLKQLELVQKQGKLILRQE